VIWVAIEVDISTSLEANLQVWQDELVGIDHVEIIMEVVQQSVVVVHEVSVFGELECCAICLH
jgi:hypothetical protein